MEADWDEITRIAVPSSGLHAIPTPASAVAFDDLQELVWVGNDQVCRPFLRYTMFRWRSPLILLLVRDGSHHFMVATSNDMSRSKLIWAKAQSNSY